MSYIATGAEAPPPKPKEPSFLDRFLGGLKTAGKTALDIQIEAARQRGASEAELARIASQGPAPSTTPAWLLPVALGGGALVLVLLLMPKKRTSAPAAVQNPGRRRRRRR